MFRGLGIGLEVLLLHLPVLDGQQSTKNCFLVGTKDINISCESQSSETTGIGCEHFSCGTCVPPSKRSTVLGF